MKMNLLQIFLLLLIITGCGGDDTGPVGLNGNWELSNLIFESESTLVAFSDSRTTPFSLEFKSDNTLMAEGTNAPKNYIWEYSEGVLIITNDLGEQKFDIVEDGSTFQYVAFTIENMSTVSDEYRSIVELAASTFNQRQVDYDISGPLTVYFKFKRL